MLKKAISAGILVATLGFVGCNTTLPGAAMQQENLSTLQSQAWTLTHIGNSAVNSSNPATLQFDPMQQRVSGSDGCNRLMGGYDADAKKISFTQLASTKMMCMDNMKEVDAFNQALEKVTGYQAYNKSLRLLDRNGNVLLKFSGAAR